MGIDAHGVNFLRYSAKKKALGRVATMGRQSLMVKSVQAGGGYCEKFLMQEFGATRVDSYDYSDYESATHIVDMNRPLGMVEEYDTVIDCGTSEHIFNVSQALRNISRLGAPGAQIIHVLPANNFCGHGFWQFSPELFFSLYSSGNGYAETEVFLADLENNRSWFAVEQPRNGERANVVSKSPLYVLCRTLKVSDASEETVQQSDYVFTWSHSRSTQRGGHLIETMKKVIKKNSLAYRAAVSLYGGARATIRAFVVSTKLSSRNRHLRKLRVSKLLAL
jgi:hypothetical protein